MYWDINKTLSYNCLLNIVNGGRRTGKSYGCAKKVIQNFIKRGEQFIYLRRYESELDKSKETYFNAINSDEIFDELITFKNNKYYYGDEVCGYAMALSKSQQIKGANYNKVIMIIFDEYLIEDTQHFKYIKNEPEKLLSLATTVSAFVRPVKVFLLGNVISYFNIYTEYFQIQPKKESGIYVNEDKTILVELVEHGELTEKYKNSVWGKFIDKTEYGRYAIDNKSLLEDNIFIKKKKGKLDYYCTISHSGYMFGIWVDVKNLIFYISEDYIESSKIYVFSFYSHSEKTTIDRKSLKFVRESFEKGKLFFENQRVKMLTFELIIKL